MSASCHVASPAWRCFAVAAIGVGVLVGAACRAPSRADARADDQSAGTPHATQSYAPSQHAPPTPAPSTAVVLDPRVYDAAAAASIASPAVPAASTEPPLGDDKSTRRRYVVAAIGDSLTDPKSHGGRYLRYLAAQCPESRFESRAKGGEMVNQMRRRFHRDVLSDAALPDGLEYTDVIVFGGVNDLYSDKTAGRTVAKIQDDLSIMYRAAREAGLRVIGVTVTPWGGFTRYYSESRAAATRELNAWILLQAQSKILAHAIDAFALLSCGDAERLCPEYAAPIKDGLHFGPKGHERLGQALHRAAFADCR